jgi:hypothetical protein
MPNKRTIERARQDRQRGKAASTQAGEFVREEIEHIRQGKHGARSAKQAIAIGLSQARRAGVRLAPPEPGAAPERVRRRAERDIERSETRRRPAPKRARATTAALERESRRTVSRKALSKQARSSAPRARRKKSKAKVARMIGRSRQRRTRAKRATSKRSASLLG